MSNFDEALRIAARDLLNQRVAMAIGRHNPTAEARAWDRFALALDAAEDAAMQRPMTDDERRANHVADSQCGWLTTTRLAFDTACLISRPCPRHELTTTRGEQSAETNESEGSK